MNSSFVRLNGQRSVKEAKVAIDRSFIKFQKYTTVNEQMHNAYLCLHTVIAAAKEEMNILRILLHVDGV